ncbi:hypothetical protein [Phascolarctobacterium sp.]
MTEDSLCLNLGSFYGIRRGLDCGPNILMNQYTPSDAEQKLHHQISETLFRLAGELAEEERRRNE